jgi:hypothetical protein
MSGSGQVLASAPPDAPQFTPVSFKSVFVLALPLIAAEVFLNVYSMMCSVILSREFDSSSEYLLSPIFHAGLAVGPLIIIIGHIFDHAPWARRKLFLLIAMLFQIAGFSFLSFLDSKFAHDGVASFAGTRQPLVMSIPGCFCSLFSISILQLCGRSFLLESFSISDQQRAQSWAATVTLGTTSIFKLVFGSVIRSSDPTFNLDLGKVRVIGFSFGVLGLVVVACAVGLIREGAPRRPPDWGTVGRFDIFPQFTRIAIPLIVGSAPYVELGLMTPLQSARLAHDEPGESWTFSAAFGYGFVSQACGALLAVATAWLPHPRGALVWSLLVAALIAQIYDYQVTPTSLEACLGVTAAVGIGAGALSAAPWVAFAQCAGEQPGVNRLTGLLIGFLTILQGGMIQTAPVDERFFVSFSKPRPLVVCLLVAAIAALRIPDAPTPGSDVDYTAIASP